MAKDSVQLVVEILGRDGLTKILQTATRETKRMEREAKKSAVTYEQLNRHAFELQKQTEAIDQDWARVATGINQASEFLGKAVQIAQQLGEQTRLYAQEEARARRFADIYSDADAVLARLQAASGEMLATDEIRQFAILAKQAGIATEDLAKVLNVSFRASVAQGLELNEVVEKLLKDVIIGASDSALEELGIIADLPELTKSYARQMGIAESAIDKSTESAAALNFVLTKVADRFKDVETDSDTFVKGIGQAEAGLKDLASTARSWFVISAKEFFDAVTFKSVRDFYSETNTTTESIERMAASMTHLPDKSDRLAAAQKRHAQIVAQLNGEMFIQGNALETVLRQTEKTIDKIDSGFQRIEEQRKLAMQLLSPVSAAAQEELGELPEAPGADTYRQEAEAMRLEVGGKKSLTPKRASSGAAKKAEDEAQRRLRRAARKRSKAQRERLLSDKRFREALEEGLKLTEKARRDSQARQERFDQIREEQIIARQERELRRAGFYDEEDPLFARQMQAALAEEAAQVAERTQVITDSVTAMRDGFSETGRAVMLMGDALGYTGERMRDMQMVAQGFDQIGESIKAITAASIEFDGNNERVAANYVSLADTIVGAGGQAALGFIKGERERAGVLAAMEYAHAGAALATGILTGAPNAYVASAIHLANAGLYTAIASGAGGGGSRGASAGGAGRGASGAAGAQGARRLPQFGQQMQRQDMQPAQVVVNMSGAIVAGANRRKTANDLGDLVQESMAGRR